MNNFKHLFLILIGIQLITGKSLAAIYYIDAVNGSDKNSGLSIDRAWRTLQKASSFNFQPGDQILLKGGQTFNGSLIIKSQIGKAEAPFRISSFGKESAIISSGDSTAILAINCKFMVVKNLICLGSGRLNGNNASGVDFRQSKNITIDSIDVSGYLFSGINTTGGSDIRITNVFAHDNGFCGIHITSDNTGKDNSTDKTVRNVYIGYSTADNNPGCPAIKDNHSGNGILVGGVTNALIEFCEAMNNGWDMPRGGNGPVGIWAYMSDSVIIQNCYAHHNKTSPKGHDGGGFDFDGGITNSIMQYNLSAFNEGAGYGMFQYASAKLWNNNIVRYNISLHDGVKHGQCGIFMWCDPAAIPMKNLHAYNNTVINKYGHGVNFLPGHYENFVFENNIFLVTGRTEEFTGGKFTGALFDKNLYWNSFHAQTGLEQPKIRLDERPVVADPLITLPIDDSFENLHPETINSVAYFKLKSGSPALRAGKIIPKNAGKDYWGNKLNAGEATNIGADETHSPSVSNLSAAEKEFRRNIPMDSGWMFHRGALFGAEKFDFNDAGWRKQDLPHDWSIENIPGKNTPFDRNAVGQQSTGFTQGGTAWYRKYFEVPASSEGKTFKLRFDGVYCNSVIWVNGKSAGKYPYGYTTFEFDITDKIIPGKKNLIAVKVMNEGENTRWYSGSGIYRHVWLDILNPVHIPSTGIFITTPQVEKSSATVNVATHVINSSKEDQELKIVNIVQGASGVEALRKVSFKEVKSSEKAEFTDLLQINSPELWSTDQPDLYTLTTEVYRGGQLCDQVVTKFGIRSFSFDATNGFTLNGIPTKLRGGCVHHDNGPLGAKAYDRAEERRVELLKASGYNAIRCAHNPPSPAFLDACDRLGLLVINEAFDMWETGKHPFDYHLFFKEWWQKDLESMILRDRNHPSVIMWSIGNEIPGMNTPEVVNTAKMLADHARKLDPTRPITAGVNQVREDKDPFFENLDIAGYNYAFDWYKKDHQPHPKRVMVATESSPFLAFEYWMGVVDNPWVIGDFVWTSFDYIGEASIGWRGFEPDDKLYPWSLAYCGDIDICGWKRPQSFYRDVLWKPNQISVFVKPPSPTFEINQKKEFWSQWEWHDVLADWTWPDNEGKPMEVSVYSSCEQVELFLNGKSLGKKITNRTNKFTAMWNVPYQSGTLKAIGYTKGKKVNESVLETSGAVERIHVLADRTELVSGKQDLCFFTVELTDSKGVRNPKAENTITFQVEGPGEIVGLGNANPVSLESYQGNTRNAWQGKCLVIIKAGANSGKVTLKAMTDSGIAGEATITVK